MDTDRRNTIAFIIIALLVIVATPAVADTYLSSHFTATGGPYGVQDGPVVNLGGTYEIQSGNPMTADSVNISTLNSGHVVFTSQARTNATIVQITGTWTRTDDLDVDGTALTISPSDKSSVAIEGNADRLEWRDTLAADDGQTDVVYESPGGTSTLTLNGLPSNTQFALVDANSDDVLAVASTDNSGTATFTGLDSGTHDAQLQTSTGGPVITDVSPADGSMLQQRNVTISAAVNDSDFPHDSVTGEIYVDGQLEDSETLNANGTVETEVTIATGGDHDIRIEVTDQYGATDSVTSDVQVPSTLYLRPVTAPQELLNGTGIDATVTLIPRDDSGNIRIEQSVTDGKVNLTDVPVSGRIVAQVQEDQYYTRRILIPSIYDQQSIYLLNTSETAVDVSFELQDNVGQYPASSTYLIVRRPLDTGNGTDWQAVTGDSFDATGSFQTQLQPSVRYQLIVENDQGDRQVLGYYDPPDRSDVEPLPIGTVSISGDIGDEGWTAGAELKEVNGQATVGYRYFDPDGETTSLTINIYNTTGTETQVYSSSFPGPIRSQSGAITLPNQAVDGSYRVEFVVDRNDQTTTDSVDVGTVSGFSLNQVIGGASSLVGLVVIALAGIVVVTASSSGAVIAATIVAFFVSLIGLAPIHPVQIGVAGTIGLVYHFGTS